MSPARLLLASASPRRSALLDQIGVTHRVVPAHVDETHRMGEAAADYVCRLALDKARAGWRQRQDERAALGADTAVVLDGDILGKPADAEEAEAMLARLSGRAHRVCSAVALTDGTREEVRLSESEVWFRAIAPAERARYVATGEPLDKAGAYAIQGWAAIFIEHLSGSYSGVMGLPLYETAALLELWDTGTPPGGGHARDGAA
ncbi:Maf family protein [Acidihalobacter prosperus]|uniref:dTTP/UTP pyrophosphatase n=1 Tax=Acidihalobacter prosperus TaxID=160660 RepID=A0A1A6C5Z8_9GAMM|nr:Maf family protein [Acidihalobacter prosperus]OBS09960.1 hypothetical protein Thpro_021010 [Acidihalobacter prosperus]